VAPSLFLSIYASIFALNHGYILYCACNSRATKAFPGSTLVMPEGRAEASTLQLRGGSILSSYNSFASKRPFENGVLIALLKT
jgi:hypothetical protein